LRQLDAVEIPVMAASPPAGVEIGSNAGLLFLFTF
jgi:hypothetical protein